MSDQESFPGAGQGREVGFGAAGRSRRNGNRAGAGTGGVCVCPHCGATLPHQRGVPCFQTTCPDCGAAMLRS
jgi:hypothetical protein